MKAKIKIKHYQMDESLNWEERYKALETHHLEETKYLIKVIEELEKENEELNRLFCLGNAQ